MWKGDGKECGWFFKNGDIWCRYDKQNEALIESYYKNRVETPFQITLNNCDYLISFQDWKQIKVGDAMGIGWEIKKDEVNRKPNSGGAFSTPSTSQSAEMQLQNPTLLCIIILIVAVILQTYYNK
jgi:WWE domain